MSKWVWLETRVVLAAHDVQLAEHGGQAGVRDLGLLESAMARPRNLVAYGNPDASALAAAYAFGLAKNHPFIDGNKRTALVALETFLELNDHALAADDVQSVVTILGLAEGTLTESELAEWIRRNLE